MCQFLFCFQSALCGDTITWSIRRVILWTPVEAFQTAGCQICRRIRKYMSCSADKIIVKLLHRIGFSERKFSPWRTKVSCYAPVWKAKLTWSHTAQRADLSDILLFQVEAIVCYSLFFFTERQTIHLLTGVNNTHWKEKQERGRDSAWKKNHQFLFQM